MRWKVIGKKYVLISTCQQADLLFNIYVCIHVGACVFHRTCVEVRGQFGRVSSPHLTCGSGH